MDNLVPLELRNSKVYLGMIEYVPKMKALDMDIANDAIVKFTQEVISGHDYHYYGNCQDW